MVLLVAYLVTGHESSGFWGPLWIVTMRGAHFLPEPSPPPYGDPTPQTPRDGTAAHDEPPYLDNYIHISIDAMEGKWISAGNTPAPKP